MSTHIFILGPYKGVSTRHTCPNCHRQRCFFKYIDTDKQIKFPEYVRRCDHEQKCGYHFSPRDYFEQNPSEKEKFTEDSFRSYTPIKEVQPIATSYIDLDIVNQSLRSYPTNKLFQFLSAQFGETETIKLMKRYKIGTSNIFPTRYLDAAKTTILKIGKPNYRLLKTASGCHSKRISWTSQASSEFLG